MDYPDTSLPRVLADTGALYALLDRDDAWHQRVRDWWEGMAENVRVPVGGTGRNSFRYQELPYPPLPYGKVTNWSRNALAGSVSSR